MKTVILALVVLMVVSQGQALECLCEGTTKICLQGPVETCYGSDQVCGSFTIQAGPHISYSKGCMSEGNCRLLSSSPVSSGYCCHTDRCNR